MRLSGVAVLARRFVLGLRPAFAALARRFVVGSCPAFAALARRFVLGLHPAFAVLAQRFVLGSCPAFAVLVRRFAFGVRPALRFCWGRLPRFTPAVCRMATNRTACDILRFYSAGSRSPFVRSRGVGAVICLGGFTSGLAVSCRRSRRVTGNAESGERETGMAAQHSCPLRNHIGLAMLSAGSTLGLRAPDCAKESSTLWTLFRGCPSEKVRFTRRGCVGANTHPCKKH